MPRTIAGEDSNGVQRTIRTDVSGNIITTAGTGASDLGKAEDAAHVSGDTGIMSLGVRKDTAAALAGTDGDYQPAIFDANGRMHVNAGNLPTTVDTNSGNKSASTLRVVMATDQPAMTNAQPVNLQPTTSGGSSIYRNLDLGSTGQVVKNGAGQLYGYYIYNNSTSVRFLKIYDKATAATNSDTPVMTYPIPAGSAANVAFPNGIAFANGISVRATTAIADNDTGAPSTNDVVVNLNYK